MSEEEESEEIVRSQRKLDRNRLQQLFQLSMAQPWLEQRQAQLLDTMDLCADVIEQSVLCDLLYRFTHISTDRLAISLEQVGHQIAAVWKCDPVNTRIVAINRSRYSDSSQSVLWQLKSIMAHFDGWGTTNFVAKMSDALPQSDHGGTIILIDEFVGTGDTFSKAIKWYRKKLDEVNSAATIYACALAAMEQSKSKLEAEADGLFVAHWLGRGISDHYTGVELNDAIAAMERLESVLAPEVKQESLSKYSFGYKKSEALYYLQNGNPVNNLFPIFWWPKLKSSQPWSPILRRL